MSELPPMPSSPTATSGAVAQRAARRWIHLPRRPLRRALFLGIYAAFCSSLVFLGTRLFWKVHAGVPFDEAAFIRDYYFPEIRRSQVKETQPRHADSFFDVLLLGGSVLEPGWGHIEENLRARLQSELGDRFRIFNLAHSAHTSRDSLLKYQELAHEEFDLVIVYDGINDVRLNCCPRESFRDDYTHFAWYKSMQRQIDSGTILNRAGIIDPARVASQAFAFDSRDSALLEEGGDIKTPRAFRRNLEEIVRAAADRGDAILLLTYAYYIPADYSQERFRNRALDYSYRADDRHCDVETWGKPPYVAAAVDAHNEGIRNLAHKYGKIGFVDERRLMPEDGRLFVDPCHLTDAGSGQFVDNLWPAVARRLESWKSGRGGRPESAGSE
jgi:hypothetical protein